MSKHHLTKIQRFVLMRIWEAGPDGMPLVSGSKKTRFGYFAALKVDGVSTQSTTIYFLRHHGYIESETLPFYRLTLKGSAAVVRGRKS